MKKMLGILLVLVCMSAGSAYGAALEISCGDCANAAVGSEITCTVSMNSTPNEVATFGFDLLYNPDVLSYISFTKGTLAQNRFDFFGVNQQGSGHLRIGGFEIGTNPLPSGSGGDFLLLTFQVMAKGACGAKFSNLTDDFKCWPTNPAIVPVIPPGQSFSVNENSTNGTTVGMVSVTDDNNESLTFSIVSGNTDSAFAVSSSGEITVNDSSGLDCSAISVYSLKVRVSGCSGFAEADMTVNVTGALPVIQSGQSFTIRESSANGTAVGTVAVTGGSKTMTFSIVSGNTDSAFAVSSSGVITVNDSSRLDCSAISVYSLKVRVSGCSGSAEADMTVNVTGTLPVIQSGQSFTIPENSANGTAVGTVAVTGGSQTMTFSIEGGNDIFAVSNSGVISVTDSTKLDCSVSPYSLKILVSGCFGSSESNVTVNVTGTAPVVPSNQSFSIPENIANSTVVGTVIVTEGNHESLTFGIIGGDAQEVFAISDAGVITVTDNTKLDFCLNPIYSLKVQVSGPGGSTETTVTVNIEKPVKGNVNDDCKTDLQDAILSLQILTGIQTEAINPEADINNDGRIGLEEVIYILRDIANIK